MISYNITESDFRLQNKAKLSNWLKNISREFGHSRISLNYIFANDDYILKINQDFLGHDYYTDVITFDTTGYDPLSRATLSADIYISIDTVRSNAGFYHAPFEQELHRVMVHGLLHLLGFDDHTEQEKKVMVEKENHYLSVLNHE